MDIYHVISGALGGSSIYDSNWNKIGYSLPSPLGKGEDFYDMNGNELGQSYELAFGGEGFTSATGDYGFLDEEILNTRNLYLDGKLFEDKEVEDDLTFSFHEDQNPDSNFDNRYNGLDSESELSDNNEEIDNMEADNYIAGLDATDFF